MNKVGLKWIAAKIDSLPTPLYGHRQHDKMTTSTTRTKSTAVSTSTTHKTLTTTTTSSTFTSTSTPVIPLKAFSVLIIFPVWYPDVSPPPTQPKGLNPLEGFISVDLSACMVP